MGIAQLEDLYRLILTSWENVDVPAEDALTRRNQLDGFRHVIGTIIVLEEPLSIQQIIALLTDIPEDKFDVTNFLRQMRSVLIPGTTESFEQATPQMHKSFRDYIRSDHTPDDFRISTGNAHFVTARNCSEMIGKAWSQDVRSYAITYWHRHMRQAVEEGHECKDDRMWELLAGIVNDEDPVITKGRPGDMFENVAIVGWLLFMVRRRDSNGIHWLTCLQKYNLERAKLVQLSTILKTIKVSCYLSQNSSAGSFMFTPLVPRKCVLCSLVLSYLLTSLLFPSSLACACSAPC
jgi:hypothetical protein